MKFFHINNYLGSNFRKKKFSRIREIWRIFGPIDEIFLLAKYHSLWRKLILMKKILKLPNSRNKKFLDHDIGPNEDVLVQNE